jgi:GR25 family glycosyltransferase involved in LPS biosynthesis
MIHNCEKLRGLGAPYYYELNQILEAVEAWKKMSTDYASLQGFFAPGAKEKRTLALKAAFNPCEEAQHSRINTALKSKAAPLPTPIAVQDKSTLRVAFAFMWDDFQPRHNFFMYLLSWVGSQNGIKVVLDEEKPQVVFCGPFSEKTVDRWPDVHRVYFTGENSPPDKSAFLNIGFRYELDANYIRLPLWILEVNWWGADVDKIANPRPVPLNSALKVDPAILDSKQKFCAFVATNPSNGNRNLAFHILNAWAKESGRGGVDSGGRLFTNLPEGPLPAGRGGGGGELIKVDFYKKYKFVLTFENSSSPGYTTEKLFHAKVAGAVPIYWGDPFVDRDFDSAGFINANKISKPEDLINLVQKVADDPAEWRRMAAIPAISEFRLATVRRSMVGVAAAIFRKILGKDVGVQESAWASAEKWGAVYEERPLALASAPALVQAPALGPELPSKRILMTAATTEYVEAAVNLFASIKQYDADCKKIIYLWPNVPANLHAILKQYGADEVRVLPNATGPWPDYWEPKHFAWKLWVQHDAAQRADADACVLYLDAGTTIAAPPAQIWRTINSQGVFLLDDATQTNERWCHPTFCKNLQVTPAELASNQITAGLVGFKPSSRYTQVLTEALKVAETRENIVGEKWNKYSDVCFGHRHDQSILSVLTQRHGLPRQPLNDYYCDTSMRAAQQFGTPLYVHRGNFKALVPLCPKIDEAYLINLPRRSDRLQKFKAAHGSLAKQTYVSPAVDGRTLQLTAQLVDCFRDNDFHWKKAIMGCALSHLRLWEKLANDPLATTYLIMEDDVKLASDWMDQWKAISHEVPADADVVYLGGILPPNKEMFKTVVEHVSPHFARVAANNLFGGHKRRYFHFCNYAYMLTKTGAQKLVGLVKEKGIFTSGDHMIVNHGDSLLKIYFTQPLLATCFQEEDPVYQKSEFNNFSRIDNFDSDLWNNDERFSKEEIAAAAIQGIKGQQIQVVDAASPAGNAGPAEPAPSPVVHVGPVAEQASEEKQVAEWNKFLKYVATKDHANLSKTIDAIFVFWAAMNYEAFMKKLSWFRIFEQLILSNNAVVKQHHETIKKKILETFKEPILTVWKKVLTHLEAVPAAATPAMLYISNIPNDRIAAFHSPDLKTDHILEVQWLDDVFPKKLHYKPYKTATEVLEVQGTPILIHMKSNHRAVLDALAAAGKSAVVVHLSDEFGNDDLSWYAHPGVKKVVRNYWRPDLAVYKDRVLLIPLGYANGHSAKHLPAASSFTDRSTVWSFAGSLDRTGRLETLTKLFAVKPNNIHTKESWASKNLLEGTEYNESLRTAKFVPCLRGSCALESYRLYEALEHGAIPIYVPAESAHGGGDELKEQFGPHPLLGFPSWEKAAEMLPLLATKVEVMEKHRASLADWWNKKKAEMRQAVAALF